MIQTQSQRFSSRSGNFRIMIESTNTHAYLTLVGVLSEQSRLRATDIPPFRAVIVDTSQISRINSSGVRGWAVFINELCEKSLSVTITGLAPALARQSSIVANFLGTAHIGSFFTPWSCNDCAHEESALWDAKEKVPDFRICPACNSDEFEFDDFRATYLAFLGNQRSDGSATSGLYETISTAKTSARADHVSGE